MANIVVFRFNFSSSTNSEIGRSDYLEIACKLQHYNNVNRYMNDIYVLYLTIVRSNCKYLPYNNFSHEIIFFTKIKLFIKPQYLENQLHSLVGIGTFLKDTLKYTL